MRELAFPLLLLPFMIPIPAVIYNQITFPLQLFASRVAEGALDLLGYPGAARRQHPGAGQPETIRGGGVQRNSQPAFAVVSYRWYTLIFSTTRVWMRWVLLVATIPIAIVANAGRVTITGILSEINPELAHGFFHELEGWVIFVIALRDAAGAAWGHSRRSAAAPGSLTRSDARQRRAWCLIF